MNGLFAITAGRHWSIDANSFGRTVPVSQSRAAAAAATVDFLSMLRHSRM